MLTSHPPTPIVLQVRAPLEKKLVEDPQLFETLQADIVALAAELAALDPSGAENGRA